MNFRSSLRKKRKPLRSQTVGSFSFDSRMNEPKIDLDLLKQHENEKQTAEQQTSPVSDGKIFQRCVQNVLSTTPRNSMQVPETRIDVHKIFDPDAKINPG